MPLLPTTGGSDSIPSEGASEPRFERGHRVRHQSDLVPPPTILLALNVGAVVAPEPCAWLRRHLMLCLLLARLWVPQPSRSACDPLHGLSASIPASTAAVATRLRFLRSLAEFVIRTHNEEAANGSGPTAELLATAEGAPGLPVLEGLDASRRVLLERRGGAEDAKGGQ
eukprot:CAMPEP_0115192960 /NCGR_PEP_ID=MMETSP0270-20121206/13309_1 /TAXON_ID=71861 /ORGANISM="Scrippsiella trochoidea, Strain CCMP3099" /LENGTH=168 /DNA_ID=CAMNT_0002606217 /DNA_START=233 /DNA_END=741 /DNA_ORIENTATION=-